MIYGVVVTSILGCTACSQ